MTQRGLGRVQFMAHKAEIERRLAAGETGRMIYDDLASGDRPKITLSYRNFMNYVRKEVGPQYKSKHSTVKPKPSSPSPSTGNQQGGVKKIDFGEAETGTPHNPTPDESDLY
jgi:hypothetical protein